MKRILLIVAIVSTFNFQLSTCRAESGDDAYRKGDYETAVERYEAVLDPAELADMAAVAAVIRHNRGITPDDICPEACLPYARVIRLVGMLESDGFISMDLLQRCTINVKIS